jgi:hypothetical protein
MKIQGYYLSKIPKNYDYDYSYLTNKYVNKVFWVMLERGEDGVLRATWTRIATAPSHHVNLIGNVTIIGAASFDTSDASEQCLDFMQTHTIVQPGVAFTFPS